MIKATTAQITKVKEKLAKVGIKLVNDSEWNVFRIYPIGDKDSTYETNGRSEEDLQDALGTGLDLAKSSKRQNPKSKVSKKKIKKIAKKATKKVKKTKRIVKTGRPTYRRIAGENAAGGFGAGFGIGAGHAFGDWIFD